jgi:hypothetical protein
MRFLRFFDIAVTIAYYPVYLSILGVDKIKQKFDLD